MCIAASITECAHTRPRARLILSYLTARTTTAQVAEATLLAAAAPLLCGANLSDCKNCSVQPVLRESDPRRSRRRRAQRLERGERRDGLGGGGAGGGVLGGGGGVSGSCAGTAGGSDGGGQSARNDLEQFLQSLSQEDEKEADVEVGGGGA